MLKTFLVAVLVVWSAQFAMAQPPGGGGRGGRGGRGGAPAPPPAPPPGGLECFENLPTPEFPRAALQQKVDGTVWVDLQGDAQGTPGKMETQVTSAYADGAKLLTPPVETAIHAAKLKPECAGKPVHVVFRYELHGLPVANPEVSSHKEPSYLVWIESQPMATAGNAPAKGAKK